MFVNEQTRTMNDGTSISNFKAQYQGIEIVGRKTSVITK
jgi:hypothetical protein